MEQPDEKSKQGARSSRDLSTLHEAAAIADAKVKPVKRQTNLQWAVLGSIVLGVAGFIAWSLAFLSTVSTAQAQTSTQQIADHNAQITLTARVETIDAGRAADNQRLERKIDAIAENTDKKLTDVQATLNAMLREQRAARR